MGQNTLVNPLARTILFKLPLIKAGFTITMITFLQTHREYLAEQQLFLGQPPLNLTLLEYSQYCYDATWTLAYALNSTIKSEWH